MLPNSVTVLGSYANYRDPYASYSPYNPSIVSYGGYAYPKINNYVVVNGAKAPLNSQGLPNLTTVLAPTKDSPLVQQVSEHGYYTVKTGVGIPQVVGQWPLGSNPNFDRATNINQFFGASTSFDGPYLTNKVDYNTAGGIQVTPRTPGVDYPYDLAENPLLAQQFTNGDISASQYFNGVLQTNIARDAGLIDSNTNLYTGSTSGLFRRVLQ